MRLSAKNTIIAAVAVSTVTVLLSGCLFGYSHHKAANNGGLQISFQDNSGNPIAYARAGISNYRVHDTSTTGTTDAEGMFYLSYVEAAFCRKTEFFVEKDGVLYRQEKRITARMINRGTLIVVFDC